MLKYTKHSKDQIDRINELYSAVNYKNIGKAADRLTPSEKVQWMMIWKSYGEQIKKTHNIGVTVKKLHELGSKENPTAADKEQIKAQYDKLSKQLSDTELFSIENFAELTSGKSFEVMKNSDVATLYTALNRCFDVRIIMQSANMQSALERDKERIKEYETAKNTYEEMKKDFFEGHPDVEYGKLLEEYNKNSVKLGELKAAIEKNKSLNVDDINADKLKKTERIQVKINGLNVESSNLRNSTDMLEAESRKLSDKLNALSEAKKLADDAAEKKVYYENAAKRLNDKSNYLEETKSQTQRVYEELEHLTRENSDKINKADKAFNETQNQLLEYSEFVTAKDLLMNDKGASAERIEDCKKQEKLFLEKIGCEAKSINDKKVLEHLQNKLAKATAEYNEVTKDEKVTKKINELKKTLNALNESIETASKDVKRAEIELGQRGSELNSASSKLNDFCKKKGVEAKDIDGQIKEAENKKAAADKKIVENENEIAANDKEAETLENERDKIFEEIDNIEDSIKEKTKALEEEYNKLDKRQQKVDWAIISAKKVHNAYLNVQEKAGKLIEGQKDVTDKKTLMAGWLAERANTLYRRKDDAKGKHQNSPEYDKMMEELDNMIGCSDPKALEEATGNLKKAAKDYLDAKHKQFRPAIFESALRRTRLTFAESILSFAETAKQSMEMISEKDAKLVKGTIDNVKKEADKEPLKASEFMKKLDKMAAEMEKDGPEV